jgi:hypothetical protein
MIKNVHWSSCKVPVTFIRFKETRVFPTDFQKIFEYQFMKIRPIGGELFHAEGRTDMTKLTVAFRNLANAPKNSSLLSLSSNERNALYTSD